MMIKVALNKKDLKAFIRLPWMIYKNDPHWCPPFLSECKKMFMGKHPFYEYGSMQLFIAEKDGEVVGRIAAIKNDLHNAHYKDKTGFFGFFECIDDQALAHALLDAAKSWLKSQGCDKMRGPASPSSSYDYGCQYSGFEHDQVLLSTHNAPYYFKLMESYGLKKEIDLYAYKITKETVLNSATWKLLSKFQEKKQRVKIHDWSSKSAKHEIVRLAEIFNSSWRENHGFIPITNKEVEELYSGLKPLIKADQVLFAEADGKIVGGAMYLLDYHQIFKKMDGKLFPWNIVKIFTQRKKITRLRAFMTGIMPEYRTKSAFPLMFYELIKRTAATKNAEWLEASYILENNHFMRGACEKIGGEIYKKYRVFEIPL